ncbi:helix-turn-helix domain-containing protein [Solicola gregarius]|uniref:MarR family transcriptional regulator n=1 Tax=Solicola gregarius TaxID=2908642 RepID=A0AA46TG91_9ACTN|nr:MarR family transcriptional regulator [Solicola gregarius]UYM04247.1 MarR family transcriptional regulator [Solicola gregarius]
METPLGPRLIGETEKSLNAVLRRLLAGTDLSEPQWVTLRLSGLLDGTVDAAGLADAARDRAQFTGADDHVAALTARGLLDEGVLTDAGRELLDRMQARITEATRPVWEGLPEDDVAATTRVLNQVAARARALLTEL